MAKEYMDTFQSAPDQNDVDPSTIKPADLPLDAAATIIEMTQGAGVMQAKVTVHDKPAKLVGEATMTSAEVKRQADLATECLVPVDYSVVRGTCGDERERVGLKSGESKVAPRPSIWGGPEIYGLYVSEMAGVFNGNDLSADERLEAVVNEDKIKQVPAGGHEHCAAAGSFGAVLGKIAENREGIHQYAKSNMEAYDSTLMDEAIDGAVLAVKSGRYEGWDGESALAKILGKEADEAIEKLADVPHKGRTIVRVKRPGHTVDQTELHNRSGGEDSFVQDDPYADFIEKAHAGGDTHKKRVMEHAREALLVGVSLAVPNTEIHQIDLN